jgi:hypothetical protein
MESAAVVGMIRFSCQPAASISAWDPGPEFGLLGSDGSSVWTVGSASYRGGKVLVAYPICTSAPQGIFVGGWFANQIAHLDSPPS